jgi:shikimate kinase
MRRILILGRGGAGKSTLAARLGATLALPVIELDKHFWAPDAVMAAIAANAGDAQVHVLRTPRAVQRFLDEARTRSAIDRSQ